MHEFFCGSVSWSPQVEKTQNLKNCHRYGYVFLVMILCHLLCSQVITMINCYCYIDVFMENHLSTWCTIYTQLMYIWLHYLFSPGIQHTLPPPLTLNLKVLDNCIWLTGPLMMQEQLSSDRVRCKAHKLAGQSLDDQAPRKQSKTYILLIGKQWG